MRPIFAFFSLGLWASVTAIKYQGIAPASPPRSYNSLWGLYWWLISIPGFEVQESEWTVSCWIYIEELESNAPVFGLSDPQMVLSWEGTKLKMSGTKITTQEVETTGRPALKWFHAILGSHGGVSFGIVTIKGGAQYTLSINQEVIIKSTTIVTGTFSRVTFTVFSI